MIAEALHLKEGEGIEISIHSEPAFAQGELWDNEPDEVDEINDISLDISEDLHTLNMYNRIYVPEKYRFFFPPADNDFFLVTNVGQIKTHITSSGYFTKGVRSWVEINGPLEPSDQIHVKMLDEKRKVYEMRVKSDKEIQAE